MDIKKFTKFAPGQLVDIDMPNYKYAFLPDPLPPKFDWPERMWPLLNDATKELARLDGVGRHLPSPDLLLRPLQKREALKSSSLEGTVISAQELLLFEMEPKKPKSEEDKTNSWMGVFNYAESLARWESIRSEIPISARAICRLHEILMNGVRGANRAPGQFRRGPVQIGSPARFIPPPANRITDCISDMEKYIHGGKKYDPLVEALIIHYQFEAIHPFLDGNGRVGRLLLSLMISEWCDMYRPWLYMSEYFENHKDEYIDMLFNISANAEWEEWIGFCLRGVVEQAKIAVDRCIKIIKIKDEYQRVIHDIGGNARQIRIVDGLFENPIVRITTLAKKAGVVYLTAKHDIEKLVTAGLLARLEDVRPAAYFAPKIFSVMFIE